MPSLSLLKFQTQKLLKQKATHQCTIHLMPIYDQVLDESQLS